MKKGRDAFRIHPSSFVLHPCEQPMTPQRWQQINDLFQAALKCETGRRAAFLDEACAGDVELRQEVESLLASFDAAEHFMESPWLDASGPTLVGRRIGSYKILRELGHGGMGAVYLAERADNEYCKQVAIKLIKSGLANDVIIRRFRNERQILAHLD